MIQSVFFSEAIDIPSQPSLLLVVKWGGQLTQTGKNQAEALGKVKSFASISNYYNLIISGIP
jgi:hypothetical protein